ncbi:MAG: hypothetical protein KDC44_00480, partial [Phaeodactylibacter sp.]|nr:hypothetical protein [Phaeodactylibacter sp.]
ICGCSSTEPATYIEGCIKGIQQQKDDAIQALAEAERQKNKARANERQAQLARADAEVQKALAEQREQEAQKAKAEAEAQKRIAEDGEQQAQRIARSNQNALAALQRHKSNPTLALRMAEANYHLYPNSNSAAGIYRELLETGSPVYERILCYGHKSWACAAVFSPDGKSVLTGGDYELLLWDLKGKIIREFRGHSAEILGIAFSPDGQLVAATAEDGVVIIWDLEGALRYRFNTNESIYALKTVLFSPDGTKILTGSGQDDSALWDLNGRKVKTFEKRGYPQSYAPDGQHLVFRTSSETILLTDTEGQVVQDFSDENMILTRAHLSPDGQLLLSSSLDGDVTLWNLDGDIVLDYLLNEEGEAAIDFAPDGKRIATYNDSLIIWDLHGNQLQNLGRFESTGPEVKFSPDATKILFKRGSTGYMLMDLETHEMQYLGGH